MIVKVCGMRDPANIREVAGTGIQWMGFIFYPKSPRSVVDREGNLYPGTREAIVQCPVKRVGVFVDATPEEMMETASALRLDYLQLHGHETPETCHALQKRGFALLKAFPIATAADLERTQAYAGYADYFLFDTKCEGYGGSGRTFDWSVLDAYRGETPFLLSGGLSPASASALRAFHHPRWAGIDLNSGFETRPGVKEAEEIRTFSIHLNLK